MGASALPIGGFTRGHEYFVDIVVRKLCECSVVELKVVGDQLGHIE
ncbi:hypothetical protein SDC9_211218 [bioreactor metagenome]|uniref:Uncharacterized protein n=1 Tax=bioreactor metagenome TaxID=1076179 RepID=A0A645JL65_9ZZZZ